MLGHFGVEDETHENAANGILVVQVCRLWTLHGKIPQAATPLRGIAATIRLRVESSGTSPPIPGGRFDPA
jgi:hypothetical protein